MHGFYPFIISPPLAMQPFQPYSVLHLQLPPDALAGFASLLQHGVLFPMQHAVSLLPFLVSLPGFSADYIEKNVQTIFINGVAADSLDRELAAGTTVALSAAMPGLAGAIFRRQGVHGSLRSQPMTKPTAPIGAGFLTLKLFNSIATDRIGDLLHQGFLVSGKALARFAGMRGPLFQSVGLRLEGQEVEYQAFMEKIVELPLVMVQLER